MMPTIEETLIRLAESVIVLPADDDLAQANPNERTFSSELVAILKPEFPDWNVNGEYDSEEEDPKGLSTAGKADKDVATTIRPDVIVHRIMKQENLLVVEMKKHTNPDINSDVWKLAGLTLLTGDYRYALGVHLVINAKESLVTKCDVYINGAVDAKWTKWLQDGLM